MKQRLADIAYIALAVALFGAAWVAPSLRAQTVSAGRSYRDSNYTTQQTGSAFWAPSAATKTLQIYTLDLQCGGTTAGTATLWFGAAADTTFTQDTDQVLTFFSCETPSATTAKTKFMTFQNAIAVPGYTLRITTSAGITIHVTAYGREF